MKSTYLIPDLKAIRDYVYDALWDDRHFMFHDILLHIGTSYYNNKQLLTYLTRVYQSR